MNLLSRAVSNLIVNGVGLLATLVIQPDRLYVDSPQADMVDLEP